MAEPAEHLTPVTATSGIDASRWIDCDPQVLRERFDREPFALRHHLAGHPLFALPRLARLASYLETRPGEVYVDVAVTDAGQRWDQSEHPAARMAEMIEGLKESAAWIILRKPELDPEYRQLLDRTLRELRELIGGSWGKPTQLDNSIIFMTSPRRVSAYHIDRECNFILQVAGAKTVYVFDRNDREVLSEEELEHYWAHDANAAVYKPQYQERARAFYLRPGDGVHVPVNSPHWVQNDDNVSITLSVNFQFHDDDRANKYRANYYLRKLGITPAPPGGSPLRDRLKANSYRGVAALWGLLHRWQVGRGRSS